MLPKEIAKHFSNKTALVTGGTGLVGRAVCAILVSTGCKVTSMSMDNLELDPMVNYWKGDLFDFNLCKKVIRDFDYVFHLAGVKGSPKMSALKPAKFFVPTVMMNINVLEAARLNKIPRLVYTSSIGAYSNNGDLREEPIDPRLTEFPSPMDGYPGWGKLIGEMQINTYRKTYPFVVDGWTICRLSSTYGPGDNFDPENAMVIPSFLSKIMAGEKLTVVGDGTQTRDFLFSADAALGIILAGFYTARPFINIGSGKGTTIHTLLETLQKIHPFRYEYNYTNFHDNHKSKVLNTDYAKARMGFVASTSLEDGLRITWDWLCRHKSEHLNKINYFRGAE